MNFFGIPAHPLFVHFAVVGTLILALVALAVALSSRFSRWLSFGLPTIAVLTGAAVLLTKESGEQLAHITDDIDWKQHAFYADMTTAFTGLLVITCLLWWAASWQHLATTAIGRVLNRPAITLTLKVLMVLLALGVLVASILTGHSGANLVWNE